jgi:hypothetical protein
MTTSTLTPLACARAKRLRDLVAALIRKFDERMGAPAPNNEATPKQSNGDLK